MARLSSGAPPPAPSPTTPTSPTPQSQPKEGLFRRYVRQRAAPSTGRSSTDPTCDLGDGSRGPTYGTTTQEEHELYRQVEAGGVLGDHGPFGFLVPPITTTSEDNSATPTRNRGGSALDYVDMDDYLWN